MITQAHLDIARERFLEMMAACPSSDPAQAAVFAIEQADDFVSAYKAIADVGAPKLKGCKQCFGSGGKTSNPCRSCGGTGKVAQ